MPLQRPARLAGLAALASAAALAACGGGSAAREETPATQELPAPRLALPRTYAPGADPSGRGRDDGGRQAGVAWPSPRFVASTDGTVKDELTGLTWLADANCMKTHLGTFDADGVASDGAVTRVHALNFMSAIPGSPCAGSFADWRLPNLAELSTLLDWSRGFDCFAGAGFVSNVQLGYPGYWASTTDSATGGELALNFDNGLETLSLAGASQAYVLPVRGGSLTAPAAVPKTGQRVSGYPGDDADYAHGVGAAWPSPRFTKLSDGTVRDGLTGLRWAPDANLMPTGSAGFDHDGTADDGQVTWLHALDYVEALSSTAYLGHRDWRLPNVTELASLEHRGYAEELCASAPCGTPSAWLGTQGFTNVQALGLYWTSTAWARNPTLYTRVLHSYADRSQALHVWPVRGP